MTEPNEKPEPSPPAERGDDPAPVPEVVRIDMSQVKAALEMPVPGAVPGKKYQVDVARETAQTVDEIAQDTVTLLARVQAIEDNQKTILGRLDTFDQLLRGLVHQGETTRKELLTDRKASAVRSVFLAIVPVLDALEGMTAGLDPGKDALVHGQLRGVTSALRSILQGLGYEPFVPEVGALFDPAVMECAGFAEGEPGKVLAAVRPGYRAGAILVRCAGVKIANQAAEKPASDS